MRTRRMMAGLVLGVFIFGAMGGVAQAQRRNFCGVVRVRPRNCLIVPGGIVDRAPLDISSARPRPRPGTLIAGSGFDRGFSHCIRADRRLSQVTWRRVVACPQAR